MSAIDSGVNSTMTSSSSGANSSPAAPVTTNDLLGAESLHFICSQSLTYTPASDTGGFSLSAIENRSLANGDSVGLKDSVSKVLESLSGLITRLTDLVTKLVESLKAARPAESEAQTEAPGTTTPGTTTPNGGPETPTKTETPTPGTLGFQEKATQVLMADENGRISETELRRGVVVYQLYQKDSKLAEAFQTAFDAATKGGENPTAALRSGLKKIVDDKQLPAADADWVFSLSFRAAQFEGEQTALSTSTSENRGLSIPAALKIAEASLAGIQGGSITVTPKSLATAA